MKSNEILRTSLIDGTTEAGQIPSIKLKPGTVELEPVYEERTVQRATLDGVEDHIIKVLIGFSQIGKVTENDNT